MNSSESLTITTPSDREVLITRSFDAPARLIFDAWTKPEHLPQWMLGPEGWSMTTCEVDLRPGGAWHFVWRHADGRNMDMRGTYREVAPPTRLVSTESWGGDWPETVNTLVLHEQNGKTTVKLTILYPSIEARDAALKSGMKEGMALTFNRLDKLVASIAA